MAYDEVLADRIRAALAQRVDAREIFERKMFGGIAFMVRGHMTCGIVGDDLMLRAGPEEAPKALRKPHARPMDFTGKPSTGMIYVAPAGLRTAAALGGWIAVGLAYVDSLPDRVARKLPAGKPKVAKSTRAAKTIAQPKATGAAKTTAATAAKKTTAKRSRP